YLFRIFGIDVRVHWTFPIVFLWLGFNFITVAAVATLFFTVLLHELGHCFAARSVGAQAREILMLPFGGLALTSGGRTAAQWIWISLAGPLMHVPIALLCAGYLTQAGVPPGLSDLNPLAPLTPPDTSLVDFYVYCVLRLQVFLFCLNMLPAYPLDGGQVLVGLMSSRLPLKATLGVAAALSVLATLLMFQIGFSIVGILLAIEVFGLISALMSGTYDWHPVAALYGPRAAVPAPPTPVHTELRQCPHCGQSIHPRSELCAHCNATFTQD
ncbi:MAG: M50 family metallopeptidase, partial [Candidatus Eremiobacterota bacterium]